MKSRRRNRRHLRRWWRHSGRARRHPRSGPATLDGKRRAPTDRGPLGRLLIARADALPRPTPSAGGAPRKRRRTRRARPLPRHELESEPQAPPLPERLPPRGAALRARPRAGRSGVQRSELRAPLAQQIPRRWLCARADRRALHSGEHVFARTVTPRRRRRRRSRSTASMSAPQTSHRQGRFIGFAPVRSV
jgi:hypothetical protein